MRDLVDIPYPHASVIRVVMDNLSTHRAKNLYEAFAPDEARRILRRLEFHFTPKHASWLNMVEIEISVLSRQCLNRRIPDAETLAHEVAAWPRRRDATGSTFSPTSRACPQPRFRWACMTGSGLQLIGDAWDEASVIAACAHIKRMGVSDIARPRSYRSLAP